MVPKHALAFVRMACVLGLLILCLVASSCGHVTASAPPPSVDTVMKAVRDYGSRQAGLLVPEGSAKPDETDGLYAAHITSLLVQGDYAQLEKLAQQNRVEKGRLLGGLWKSWSFFAAASSPQSSSQITDADYASQLDMLNKWLAAYPQSSAARIALAECYIHYAEFVRGTGYADSVSDSQWRLYNEHTVQAEQILLDAAHLKERDAHWYFVMQVVAHNQGWNQSQARELFDQAIAFQPGYYHFYMNYAHYLLPQWYGKEGDIQALADQASARFSEPDSSILYFQIMSTFACYCQGSIDQLPHANYAKLRDGYNNLTRLYGSSDLTANRFALMATTFQDKYSAHDAFAAVTERDPKIWTNANYFESARIWANSQ
jgi:hypothetical protein